MCRVCQKRPEIPDERHGRCEPCAKAGRIAIRFRMAPSRTGSGLAVKAGELSPHALKQKWAVALGKYNQQPGTKAHLGLHEVELIVAKDRLETVRMAADLAGHGDEVVAALRLAAERTDNAW